LLNLVDGVATGSVRGIRAAAGGTLGEYAMAINMNTTAGGRNSFAQGHSTTASGDNSHAEGEGAIAQGRCTHAEGLETEATEFCAHAEGARAKASGNAAHAEGTGTIASNNWSHAEGQTTTASGISSHAEGGDTVASGNFAHAEGGYAVASGNFAHAEGHSTTASNEYAHAEGLNTEASAFAAHAEGLETHAAGYFAHAEGRSARAAGAASHAGGFYTIAQNNYQTVVGKYNVPTSSSLNGTQNDDAFIIGNGMGETSRSNAFRVQYSGNVYSASGVYTTGADYAEMLEWLDGNPQNEDRRGYFVTLDGERIRIATDKDDYVLGVVSATPAIAGRAQACGWHGMYQRDIWGAVIYEWIELPAEAPVFDKETGQVEMKTEMIRQYLPRVDPAYDAEREYLPRTERAEWAPVGLVGFVPVRDDGSCRPNGYCRPNAQGMATACERGYRVLKRLHADVVLIVVG